MIEKPKQRQLELVTFDAWYDHVDDACPCFETWKPSDDENTFYPHAYAGHIIDEETDEQVGTFCHCADCGAFKEGNVGELCT